MQKGSRKRERHGERKRESFHVLWRRDSLRGSEQEEKRTDAQRCRHVIETTKNSQKRRGEGEKKDGPCWFDVLERGKSIFSFFAEPLRSLSWGYPSSTGPSSTDWLLLDLGWFGLYLYKGRTKTHVSQHGRVFSSLWCRIGKRPGHQSETVRYKREIHLLSLFLPSLCIFTNRIRTRCQWDTTQLVGRRNSYDTSSALFFFFHSSLHVHKFVTFIISSYFRFFSFFLSLSCVYYFFLTYSFDSVLNQFSVLRIISTTEWKPREREMKLKDVPFHFHFLLVGAFFWW